MSEQLTLENLSEYDQGSLAILFNNGMQAIFLDLADRPRLKKSRKLTVEFTFKPTADPDSGDLDEIETTSKVKVSIPDREARVNILAPSTKGIVFDPDTRRTKTLPGQQSIKFSDDE